MLTVAALTMAVLTMAGPHAAAILTMAALYSLGHPRGRASSSQPRWTARPTTRTLTLPPTRARARARTRTRTRHARRVGLLLQAERPDALAAGRRRRALLRSHAGTLRTSAMLHPPPPPPPPPPSLTQTLTSHLLTYSPCRTGAASSPPARSTAQCTCSSCARAWPPCSRTRSNRCSRWPPLP